MSDDSNEIINDEDDDDEELREQRARVADSYEKVRLTSNKKADLECIGCFLVMVMIVMIIIRINNPGFTLWWIPIPISAFIATWLYAESLQKNVAKAVVARSRVAVDWQYPRGMRRCFDVDGREEIGIPDDDVALYKYVGIVSHERVTELATDIEKYIDKPENRRIVEKETRYLTQDELRDAMQRYGGNAAADMAIEFVKLDRVEYFKREDGGAWPVTAFHQCAWILPCNDWDEAMGWNTSAVPAAGWKFLAPNTASARLFYIGTLQHDVPVFMVTGSAWHDKRLAPPPTSDQLANGLVRIMGRLCTRADARSSELRTLLEKARSKLKSKSDREKRQEGERVLEEIEIMRRGFRVDNLDEGKVKQSDRGWLAWCVLGIVVVIVAVLAIGG
ncbi:MAG: hypothetical protein Q6370_021295 [Candidatus Sigynarchaeota archaeon]